MNILEVLITDVYNDPNRKTLDILREQVIAFHSSGSERVSYYLEYYNDLSCVYGGKQIRRRHLI